MKNQRLNEKTEALHLIGKRAEKLLLPIIGVFLLLLGRLFYLQIYHYEHYTTLSQDNRLKLVPIAPIRGLIYSADGVLLAENRPVHDLEIVPERVTDLLLTLHRLRKLFGISAREVERFWRLMQRKRRFDSVPLRYNLSAKEQAIFAVNRHRFPGVTVNARLGRHYPLGEEFAHILGYVGRIDEHDLRTLDHDNYRASSHTGKVGLELYHERILHGTVGYQQVEVNAQGRIIRVLERVAPRSGSDLYLNLDTSLQRRAVNGMRGKYGAIVVMDVRNGALLAAVSSPQYDPNLFVNGISHADYRALLNSPHKPLFNRLVHGEYPPASTIKPFLGLIALSSGVRGVGHRTPCPGWFRLGGQLYRDWKRSGHGQPDLQAAIAESCDVYFYSLAQNLGIVRMHQGLARFGFGRYTGVDMPNESAGLLPSAKWKREVRNEAWFPGESILLGIGQGHILATPIQMVRATAALANSGTLLQPRLLSHTMPEQAMVWMEESLSDLATAADWQLIAVAMREVVHGRTGTARGSGRNAAYEFSGKTGTAQVVSLGDDEEYRPGKLPEKFRDHALFIAFAPLPSPEVAVAIVMENAGSGSSAAAPVARELFDHYLLGM